MQKLVQDYKARYGHAPDALAALGYDAMNILLEAIKQANSDNPDKIRDAMAGMKNFKAAVTLQVQADKSFKYQTTVQP